MSTIPTENLAHILKKIKLLILDVDGVLTNGKIYVLPTGEETVCFHVHDGTGIKRLQSIGVTIAIISGRDSSAVRHRLKYLDIQHVFLGETNKGAAYDTLSQALHLSNDQIAYVGDDLPDIAVMKKVALPISVANAVNEVKEASLIQTNKAGGKGAVREVCDLIYAHATQTDD